ncbi:hypothetical protein OUZ56_032447 [Daphnia magna]|uniref:Uncharacterized protein n=1 Tax=Daphnia magna TaxID=35525 RepID=A0ABR0B8X8_9CRUS|nr:hypothetical protein OUZ56_032447 [Daphnia magna]
MPKTSSSTTVRSTTPGRRRTSTRAVADLGRCDGNAERYNDPGEERGGSEGALGSDAQAPVRNLGPALKERSCDGERNDGDRKVLFPFKGPPKSRVGGEEGPPNRFPVVGINEEAATKGYGRKRGCPPRGSECPPAGPKEQRRMNKRSGSQDAEMSMNMSE